MRKRWIIGGIMLAGLTAAYTGYWFWLAQTFERNLALWTNQQRTMGYRISFSATEPRGYPFSVTIHLTDVIAESPAYMTPWRLDAASVPVGLAPWGPTNLRIGDGEPTSAAQLQWNANGRKFSLSVDGADTTMSLSGQAIPPAIRFGAEHLELREDSRSIGSTYQLAGEIVPSNGDASPEGSIEFSVDAFQLDFLTGEDLQQNFMEVYSPSLKGRLIGAIPPGSPREAFAQWSRQGGYLDVTNISATPARRFPPRFEGSASIALDPQLQLIVAGSVTLHDYIAAIDQAIADGHMTPAQGTATKLWLSARAENDNGGLKVTLPLTIQDGFVSTGTIKLAQVPRIEWQ